MCDPPGRAPFPELTRFYVTADQNQWASWSAPHHATTLGNATSALCGVQNVRDSHKRLAGLQRLHPNGVMAYTNFGVQENARSRVQAVQLVHLYGRHVDSVDAEPDLGRFVERDSIDKILRLCTDEPRRREARTIGTLWMIFRCATAR